MKYLVSALVLIASTTANAEWSGGFSLGVSDTSGFCDQYTEVTCDRGEDFSYKFYLGHDFGDHFRIEGFWAYLGTARVEDHINVPDSATVNVGGVGVSLMGLYPISKETDLFARVGVMQTMIGEHRLERVKFMYESNSVNPTYGLGLRHCIGDSWSIRTEWEHFDIESKTPLPIDTVTLGLEFDF